MLEQHEISISCLLVWTGISVGVLLLIAQEAIGHDVGCWGLAILFLSCTYSSHRSVSAREERLREAFEMGRAHERGQRQLYSTR